MTLPDDAPFPPDRRPADMVNALEIRPSAAISGAGVPFGPGRVALVGAGPGEPGAITLRALECLAAAEVVIYDYLVNPALLRWATQPSVELISLGSHADQGRVLTQSEVSAMMVDRAIRGRAVVRLKSGDPMIFARASEEIAALRQAKIPFEIVPGVTAAVAAGSFAGIPLTDREHSSAVALITGHPANMATISGPSASPKSARPDLDWEALAKFPGTLVIYMGTTQVEYWADQLLKFGKSPATPVAIIRRCGFSDQSVQRTSLDQLIEVATQPRRIRPPVVFIIGTVVSVEPVSKWFERRPLFGHGILVTRPAEQASPLIRSLEQLGAQVYCWPAIRIEALTDTAPLDNEVRHLSSFDWVVFNSVNGVEHFLRRLWAIGCDVRDFRDCRIACIGSQTSRALAAYSLRSDVIPERFDADHLADSLEHLVQGKRCLIVRASRGRNDLGIRLRASGAQVTEVVAYQNLDTENPDPSVVAALEAGKIDWVTATSSAIAENLVRCYGQSLQHTRLASISPITSQRLSDLGFPVTVEASEYTWLGLINAIRTFTSGESNGGP